MSLSFPSGGRHTTLGLLAYSPQRTALPSAQVISSSVVESSGSRTPRLHAADQPHRGLLSSSAQHWFQSCPPCLPARVLAPPSTCSWQICHLEGHTLSSAFRPILLYLITWRLLRSAVWVVLGSATSWMWTPHLLWTIHTRKHP